MRSSAAQFKLRSMPLVSPVVKKTDTETSAPDHAVATAARKAGTLQQTLPKRANAGSAALDIVNRTARLSLDAVVILIFSPFIAVWWLNERRHRKSGR